jgi:Na+/melibiose symporter-like transporter
MEINTLSVEKKPLALKVIIIYALGQLGWSLASYGVGNLLSYFYMPPETGKTTFPIFIPQHAIFMGLTVLGLVSFGGRIFDAFIDPFVANWSDKTVSKFGKRRFFMAIAAVPMAICSFLLFFPRVTEGGANWSNVFWLVLVTFIYYISFAMYVIPYNALIAELGQQEDDRLRISTAISVTWALGFVLGTQTPLFQAILEKTMSPSAALQTVMGIFALVAAFFMLIPVFFLDEKKYAIQANTHIDFSTSFKNVFKNQNFKYFSISYLLYWLALTFIQAGIIYYVTILLGMEKDSAATFGLVSFLSSFLFYPFMSKIEKRFGKKQVLLIGFWVFCGIFLLLLLSPSPNFTFWAVSVAAAFPLAAFGIFPNTIVADIIHEHTQQTGEQQAGMFYAAAALMMKVGVSLANLLFPSLLLFGKSLDNQLGVQLTVVVAFIFCVMGWWFFRKYEER